MIISSKKKKHKICPPFAKILAISHFHGKNVAIFFGIFFSQKRVSLAMLLGT
jgi:hypothetical protein